MGTALIDLVTRVTAPWSSAYGDSALLQTGVLFLHFAGLLIAGGFAVATDRLTLRLTGGAAAVVAGGRGDRQLLLRELRAVHRPVLIGLGVVTATGLAMAAADAEFLLTSWVFWLKMAAFALLLVNGVFMLRAQERIESEPDASTRARAWRALRRSAIRSGALWVLTLLLGVVLTSV